MIVKTEVVPPYGLCDWALIKVTEKGRSKNIYVFIPLAEKAHPTLPHQEAVKRVAIERFKQPKGYQE